MMSTYDCPLCSTDSEDVEWNIMWWDDAHRHPVPEGLIVHYCDRCGHYFNDDGEDLVPPWEEQT